MNALFGLIGALVLLALVCVIVGLAVLAGLVLWLDGDDQDFS